MLGIRRLTTIGALAVAAVGLAATPALAHVSVGSSDATQGGFGHVTFRVPTESDTLSTTKLVVQLPTDQGISSVSVLPKPGWTHKETTTKLSTPLKDDDGNEITEVVSQVEWTAVSADAQIKPGEYGEFSLSLGPLPKADSIVFKAIQTYSDRSEVAWIEQATNGAEPEHPAPTLSLAAASGSADDHGAAAPSQAASSGGSAPAAAPPVEESNGTATTALVIGILGLLAGVVGIGVAISSRRASLSPSGPAAEPVKASRD